MRINTNSHIGWPAASAQFIARVGVDRQCFESGSRHRARISNFASNQTRRTGRALQSARTRIEILPWNTCGGVSVARETPPANRPITPAGGDRVLIAAIPFPGLSACQRRKPRRRARSWSLRYRRPNANPPANATTREWATPAGRRARASWPPLIVRHRLHARPAWRRFGLGHPVPQ